MLAIDTRLVDMAKASHNTYEPNARTATPEKGDAILTDVTARCLEAIGWVERGE